MERAMSIDLDNWITGHYGEDQYRDEELEIEDDLDPVTEEEAWRFDGEHWTTSRKGNDE